MDEFFIGTLMPFPYNFVPKDWLACNGQLLPIQSYTALFSLIGTYYGGDGRTNFALPHLNTTGGGNPIRAVMGQGDGPGLTPRSIGTMIGTEQVTLELNQLPTHTHGFAMPPAGPGTAPTTTPSSGGVLIDQSAGTFVKPSNAPVQLSPLTIAPAGEQAPHPNDQPWLGLYWCICYLGIYPPRP